MRLWKPALAVSVAAIVGALVYPSFVDQNKVAAETLVRDCLKRIEKGAPDVYGFSPIKTAVASVTDFERQKDKADPLFDRYSSGAIEPVSVLVTTNYRASGKINEGRCFYSSEIYRSKGTFSGFDIRKVYVNWVPIEAPIVGETIKVGYVDKLKTYLPLGAGEADFAL